MSVYGLRFTKGADVDEATLKDLLIDSQNPLLKIKSLGSGSFTFNNDSGEQEHFITTHSLSYVPLVRVLAQWYDIDTATKKTTFRPIPILDRLVGGSVYFEMRYDASGGELNITTAGFDGNGGAHSLKYIYAIYYDPEDF